MSPTSYQTAPPRRSIITIGENAVKLRVQVCGIFLHGTRYATAMENLAHPQPLGRIECVLPDCLDVSEVEQSELT
jgi:hypothetical protein